MVRTLLLVLLILPSLFLTASCGFRPLYGRNSTLSTEFAHIDVIVGQGRTNYLLGQALKHQFDRDKTPLYTLELSTQKVSLGVGVTINDVATRQDLRLTVSYLLKDKNGTLLDQGTVVSRASYDTIPGRSYEALTAEADAEEQVADEAARRLTWRLARFFQIRQKK